VGVFQENVLKGGGKPIPGSRRGNGDVRGPEL